MCVNEGDLLDVSETLKCPVCMEIFDDPVFCGGRPCQHVFCRSCVERALERSEQCPVCREFMLAEDLYPHQVIRSLLDEVTVSCEHECGWRGRRDALSAHLEVCPVVLMEQAQAKLEAQSQRFEGVDRQLTERDNRIAELEALVFEKDRQVVSSGQELVKLQVRISELENGLRKKDLQMDSCQRQVAELSAELTTLRESRFGGVYGGFDSPQPGWFSRGKSAPPPTPLTGGAALNATLEAAVTALDMPADVTREDAWLDPEGFSQMDLTTHEAAGPISPIEEHHPNACNLDDTNFDLHL